MKEPLLPNALAEAPEATLDEPWDTLLVDGDLTGAAAEDVDIARCRVKGVSFIGAQVGGGRVTDTVFERCDLSGSVWEDVFFDRVRFDGCRVAGVVLAGTRFRDVRFTDCRGDEANLRMSKGERVWFEECGVPRLDLYGVQFAEARFIRCDLTGAEVSKAKLTGARLHGSIVDGLRGALSGVVIGSDQVLPVAYGLLAAAGIVIDDTD